jgi:hypothetical protein
VPAARLSPCSVEHGSAWHGPPSAARLETEVNFRQKHDTWHKYEKYQSFMMIDRTCHGGGAPVETFYNLRTPHSPPLIFILKAKRRDFVRMSHMPHCAYPAQEHCRG